MIRFSVLLLALFAALTAFTLAYPENPPVAHTGGFGEPTCHTCHFDGDLNDGIADLSILGIDSTYVPNKNYQLTVALERDQMAKAGFQLSIRDSLGYQAGTLVETDKRAAVDSANGIQYARHTPVGTSVFQDDSSAWALTWEAPDSMGIVYVHLSANAANGDASEFGDAVYQVEYILKTVN